MNNSGMVYYELAREIQKNKLANNTMAPTKINLES